MKILLVTHYFEGHSGGIEMVAGIMARGMVEAGDAEVTWASSDTDRPPEDIPRLTTLAMSTNNWVEGALHLPYPLWSAVSVKRLFKAVKAADIVHVHDYIYLGSILAYVFAKLCKKPVVITQHIGFIDYNNVISRAVLASLNRLLGSAMLKHADRTVFISETVRSYFCGKKDRSCFSEMFIPNGVDPEVFAPVGEEERRGIRRQKGLPESGKIFLFVGRFIEKKGLHIVRALAEKFRHVTWVIAGWGDMAPESWGLSNVKVFRQPAQKDVASLCRAADLMVLPSKGEGFPLVAQEAMACGTPVALNKEVVDGYPPARELIFEVEAGGRDEVAEWIAAMNVMIRTDCNVGRSRTGIAEFAHEHWRWDRCVRAYISIFNDLLDRGADR